MAKLKTSITQRSRAHLQAQLGAQLGHAGARSNNLGRAQTVDSALGTAAGSTVPLTSAELKPLIGHNKLPTLNASHYIDSLEAQ